MQRHNSAFETKIWPRDVVHVEFRQDIIHGTARNNIQYFSSRETVSGIGIVPNSADLSNLSNGKKD